MDQTASAANAASRSEPRRTRQLPPQVIRRAESAGSAGSVWLAELDGTIRALENAWGITVGEALPGGSHAFAAPAEGAQGEQYVLKIDMPEELGGDFLCGMAARL